MSKKRKITIYSIIAATVILLILTITLTTVLVTRKSSNQTAGNDKNKTIVGVKLVFEKLNNQSSDKSVYRSVCEFEHGKTISLKTDEVKKVWTDLKAEQDFSNHNEEFSAALSKAELTVDQSKSSQQLVFYFELKKYTVAFDFADPEIKQDTIHASLNKIHELKYSYALSQTIKEHLYNVKKVVAGAEHVVSHYVDEDGNKIDFNTAFNKNIKIKPIFVSSTTKVKYIVNTEDENGQIITNIRELNAKIGSTHQVNFKNPDGNVYQTPKVSRQSLVVSADPAENSVIIDVKRKVYNLEFVAKGATKKIDAQTRRHNEEIRNIDFQEDNNFQVTKIELNGTPITKAELFKTKVVKNLKITVYYKHTIIEGVNLYPQTKVQLNQSDIQKEIVFQTPATFNSVGRVLTAQFTRTVVYTNSGEAYEKLNGEYFKFEEVEFDPIPDKKTYFTKKILDFVPFSIHQDNKPEVANFANSIFKSLLQEISEIMKTELFAVTADDGEFGVEKTADSPANRFKLIKNPTEFALAVLGKVSGPNVVYRGVNLSQFRPLNYNHENWMPQFFIDSNQYWWTATQESTNLNLVRYIEETGDYGFTDVAKVYGLVAARR